MRRKNGLILALDVTSRAKALRIADKVGDAVDAVKVGYPLVLSAGIDIIKKLRKNAPVIADFKVADIPNTSRLICERAFESGANGIIAQGFAGRDSLEACVAVAKKYDGEVYVVVEMSHPGAVSFFQPVAEKMAVMAKTCRADGIIAPATRPERVKNLKKLAAPLKVLCPGVGAQGGNAGEVIRAGADWIIVGRAIYDARNPRKSAGEIAEEIKNALEVKR
jgi:orotidine-5'-phosphate decarboxylase